LGVNFCIKNTVFGASKNAGVCNLEKKKNKLTLCVQSFAFKNSCQGWPAAFQEIYSLIV